MDSFYINFTKDEMTGLLQLLDIAVQAKGLQVAEHAVYFQNKFRQAVLSEVNGVIPKAEDEEKPKE